MKARKIAERVKSEKEKGSLLRQGFRGQGTQFCSVARAILPSLQATAWRVEARLRVRGASLDLSHSAYDHQGEASCHGDRYFDFDR
jgi:hypothetical protein